MLKVIAIVNPNGGTGKTTIGLMLSYYLALAGKKVLLIDADPQADATKKMLGANKTGLQGLYECIVQKKPLEEYIVPTEMVDVFMIPSNMNLVRLEIEKQKTSKREILLKKKLAKLKSDFDIILLDCPSSLGILTVNCLSASHLAMIPINFVNGGPLKDVGKLLNTIKIIQKKINPELSINGFLLSIPHIMSAEQESILRAVKIQLNGMMYDTIIQKEEDLDIIDSYFESQRNFSIGSKTLRAYKTFVDEFMSKIFVSFLILIFVFFG